MELRKDSSGTELVDISPMRDVSVTEENLKHLSRPYNVHSFGRTQVYLTLKSLN